MPLPRYRHAADVLRSEILNGVFDDELTPFPSSSALAERFGMSRPTALKTLEVLQSEGLIVTGVGRRPTVAPPIEWPIGGRYTSARAGGAGPVTGAGTPSDVRTETIARSWVVAPADVAALLGINEGVTVLQRRSRTYVNDRPVQDTVTHFPRAVVDDLPELEGTSPIPVVELLEGTGRVIASTDNRVWARLASADERDLFRLVEPAVVLVDAHVVCTAGGEPVKAAENVKPAPGTVLRFGTDEADG